jgi:hypothetical protein
MRTRAAQSRDAHVGIYRTGFDIARECAGPDAVFLRMIAPSARESVRVERDVPRGQVAARDEVGEDRARGPAVERECERAGGRERLLARAVGYGVDRGLECAPELGGREREEAVPAAWLRRGRWGTGRMRLPARMHVSADVNAKALHGTCSKRHGELRCGQDEPCTSRRYASDRNEFCLVLVNLSRRLAKKKTCAA